MSIIFKKLLQTNAWFSVSAILLQLYPDEVDNISGYEDLYNKLLMMDEEDSAITIVVKQQKDDFDGEEYVDVSGKYEYPQNEEEMYSQAIEFTPWRQWLGMTISEESLSAFTELEIIAHCLFELTFVGFEVDEIQEKLEDINKDVEDYKSMTDEEKKANTTSIEDLFKDLENEEEIE